MAAKVSCYTVVLKENQWIKKAGQKGRGVKKKKEEGRKRKEKGGEERGVRANNREAQAASWTPITGPDRVSRSETSWQEVADQEQDLTQPIREQDFQGPKCMVGPEHDQSESKRTTCTDSVHTHIAGLCHHGNLSQPQDEWRNIKTSKPKWWFPGVWSCDDDTNS